jgi:hypothetical protein
VLLRRHEWGSNRFPLCLLCFWRRREESEDFWTTYGSSAQIESTQQVPRTVQRHETRRVR